MNDDNPPEPSYEVRYGRPPEHTRFEPGQSGNSKGRPKGVNNLRTDVKRALAAPIKVRSDGRPRKVSSQEASIMILREKALKGDQRSLEQLLALAARFNNEPVQEETGELDVDDRAILDAFAEEILASATEPNDAPYNAGEAP